MRSHRETKMEKPMSSERLPRVVPTMLLRGIVYDVRNEITDIFEAKASEPGTKFVTDAVIGCLQFDGRAVLEYTRESVQEATQ